ncbi:sensor histidine kinase [Parathalassolituus penaei]|uniref:histidine kinase n=1 Tax=Parathalassolituus penaei TaxID=2997323 RepID=A0A9X3IS39_9GAMM|nr:ATP-binding protein [Parathalassolituus penaei]MCY0965917.1 DUF4118 domain-containing protein [Parathalassolituus penaei]
MPVREPRSTVVHQWLIALALPLLVTLICQTFDHLLPDASFAMFYLAGVLLTAFTTATGPALLAAVVSFLAFNFFFTTPRYTLFILHQEDVLTASILVLVAVLTGHLAAGLRQKVQVLENSMHWTRQQMALAQALAGCVTTRDLFNTFAVHSRPLVAAGYFRIESLGGMTVASRDGAPCVHHSHDRISLAIQDKDGNTEGFSLVFLKQQPDWIMTHLDATLELLRLALSRVQLLGNLQQETIIKEREQLRSALLSSISHDLRTPLATMIGSVSSLRDLRGSLTAEQQDELLTNTLTEARRLDRYIQKLLDMTRIGQGELKLERDWAGIDEIVSVSLRRLKPLLNDQHIETHIAEDLPLLYVHAALVEQAVFNVLENAVRYTPSGKSIRIDAHQQNDKLLIDITDSGPGMPEEQWKQVFDMFFTLAQGDHQTGGTGLGLTICQSILGAHGGQASVLFSSPDTGTCFRLTLPLERLAPEGEVI